MIGNMEIQDAGSSNSISSEIEVPFRMKRSRKFILSSSDETRDTSIEVSARCISKCRPIVYSTESEDETRNVTDNLTDQ